MPDDLGSEIQKQALQAAVKAIEGRLAALVCPEHGEKPRLKFSEDSGPGKQKMSFDCCCDRLAGMLQETLKQ
jgi:hypothetical protein